MRNQFLKLFFAVVLSFVSACVQSGAGGGSGTGTGGQHSNLGGTGETVLGILSYLDAEEISPPVITNDDADFLNLSSPAFECAPGTASYREKISYFSNNGSFRRRSDLCANTLLNFNAPDFYRSLIMPDYVRYENRVYRRAPTIPLNFDIPAAELMGVDFEPFPYHTIVINNFHGALTGKIHYRSQADLKFYATDFFPLQKARTGTVVTFSNGTAISLAVQLNQNLGTVPLPVYGANFSYKLSLDNGASTIPLSTYVRVVLTPNLAGP